jgi:hypothetical protein
MRIHADYIFFQRQKVKKRHKIVGIKVSYYFCMMIEGSGSESGSIPFMNGSGWPKNTWIRIRNTAGQASKSQKFDFCNKNTLGSTYPNRSKSYLRRYKDLFFEKAGNQVYFFIFVNFHAPKSGSTYPIQTRIQKSGQCGFGSTALSYTTD